MVFAPFYFALQFHFLILPTFRFLPSLRFFLLGIGQEDFSINHLDFLVFFYQFPKKFRSFSSIDTPVIFYYLPLWFKGFSPTTMFIIYLYAWKSLRIKEEAMVIIWSFNLVTWPGHRAWSSDLITWHGTQISFEQFYKVIISAHAKTSSLSDLRLIYNLCLIYDLYLRYWPIANVTPSVLRQQQDPLFIKCQRAWMINHFSSMAVKAGRFHHHFWSWKVSPLLYQWKCWKVLSSPYYWTVMCK